MKHHKKEVKQASMIPSDQIEALLASFAGSPESCFLVGPPNGEALVCARVAGRVHCLQIEDEAVAIACVRYLTARSAATFATLQDAERV